MISLETLISDLRQALRTFGQSPAFALAVVLALSLGIGVNTAIFSVVNTVLLEPLAFPDAERIVAARESGARIARDVDRLEAA